MKPIITILILLVMNAMVFAQNTFPSSGPAGIGVVPTQALTVDGNINIQGAII